MAKCGGNVNCYVTISPVITTEKQWISQDPSTSNLKLLEKLCGLLHLPHRRLLHSDKKSNLIPTLCNLPLFDFPNGRRLQQQLRQQTEFFHDVGQPNG